MQQRTARWALPPRPPESWLSPTWLTAVAVGSVLALLAPLMAVLRHVRSEDLVLACVHSVAGVAWSGSAYLLLVQASVLLERRLPWVAAGFGLLFGCTLLRASGIDPPGPAGGAGVAGSSVFAFVELLVLPVCALSSRAARHRLRWLAVPVGLLVALGLLALTVPPRLLVDVRLHVAPSTRLLDVAAVVLALVAAAAWARQGGRGVCAWVSAALVLTALVALLRAMAPVRYDALWWTAVGVQALTGVVPLLGLLTRSATGYHRQSRRWRQLESEVKRLRVSSPLMPGLSVTPEDEAGLPSDDQVRELLAADVALVALQPVVDMRTGEVLGQEALARLGGRVPTDRWFRGAAYAGLGVDLERLALRSALAQAPRLADGTFLAVNLSPQALHDAGCLSLLRASELSRLVVEITEHEAVGDYEQTRQLLDSLRRGGARIAVDDTGAGFASLRHVLLLQPDVVKLDIGLTRGVERNPRQRALVAALTSFAAEVGATVLAEGVETQDQVEALLDIGVHVGQGWHLGVPALVPDAG